MAASTTKKSHPIRGALFGLLLGLGLALIAVGRKIANLDSIVPILLVVVGVIIGVVWAMVGPAKQPKEPAPGRPTAQPERTDDKLPGDTEVTAESSVPDDAQQEMPADGIANEQVTDDQAP